MKQETEATRNIWEGRYGRTLDAEELRKIRENLVGFFSVLMEWDALERKDTPPATEKPAAILELPAR